MNNQDKITFLLVDNQVEPRRILTAFLKEMGQEEVLQARSGTEAWSTLTAFDAGFVVCAGELPDMTGLVLLKILRASPNYANLPFLLIMEKVTPAQVLEAGEAGVSDILTVPLNKQTFKKKVETALAAGKDPKDEKFSEFYHQGVELMKAGRYEEALAAFNASLGIYERAEIYYNMGYIRTAQGRYEEALLAFRQATRIDKAHAMSYKRMGEIHLKLGQSDQAQECLERAGEIFIDKYMDEEAEKVLLEALKLNPSTMNVFNSLGIIYRRQGKYQEAIRSYRKALRVNPEDEHIHYNLARVYMGVNNVTEARKSLIRAKELNPDFQAAQDLLRSIDMGRGLD